MGVTTKTFQTAIAAIMPTRGKCRKKFMSIKVKIVFKPGVGARLMRVPRAKESASEWGGASVFIRLKNFV